MAHIIMSIIYIQSVCWFNIGNIAKSTLKVRCHGHNRCKNCCAKINIYFAYNLMTITLNS